MSTIKGTGEAFDAGVIVQETISDSDLQVLRDNVARAQGKVDQAVADLDAARAALETAAAELAQHEGV